MYSFHFTEERCGRGGNLSPKLSVCLSPCFLLCFSFSFLQAGVGRRAALATGSREFFVEWKMSYGETFWPPIPPTRHPKMTPDPFMCLYQAMEVRNSDESLWLCVYTPESRKEGNQPRSAKSGEVRENSCSPPELQ